MFKKRRFLKLDYADDRSRQPAQGVPSSYPKNKTGVSNKLEKLSALFRTSLALPPLQNIEALYFPRTIIAESYALFSPASCYRYVSRS